MKLEFEKINIRDLQFGIDSFIKNNVLVVNKERLIEYVKSSDIKNIGFHIAKPGDSVRIIPVKDVIEPRLKMTGDGESFPGLFGSCEGVGEGTLRALKGCAVVTTGPIVGFQEGIIDMSGKGADYSEYSSLINLVMFAEPADGISSAKHEEALRIAGLKAAHFIALLAKNCLIDEVKTYELKKPLRELPRVAVLYLMMAQGLLHDNFVYGMEAKKLQPSFMHPNEMLEGAVISGNCVVAGDKFTTYNHQNNAVVEELYKRHGIDLNFVGIITVPTCATLDDKKRCCASAVRIARLLEVDGVILPEEGGGNPEADMMMLCRACEKNGIKTVLIIGPDGVEEPITDVTEEADAVINVGDCNEYIVIPKMDKIVGHEEQVKVLSGGADDCILEDGSLIVSLSAVMGSVNCSGAGKLSSFVY